MKKHKKGSQQLLRDVNLNTCELGLVARCYILSFVATKFLEEICNITLKVE